MDYIRFSNVVLQNDSGHVLVLRRSKSHPKRGLQPDLPGGTLEAGESFLQAALRELYEETRIVLTPNQLMLAYEKTVDDPQRPLIGKVYAASCKASVTDVQLSWEHDQYVWLPPEKLYDFSTFHQAALDAIFSTS